MSSIIEGQLYLGGRGCVLPVSDIGAGLSGDGRPLEASWLVAPAPHHPPGPQFFRDPEGGGRGLRRCGGRPTSGRSAEGR